MSIKTRKGDLFYISLNEESLCLGVVAEKWKKELYIVLFEERFDNAVDLANIEVKELTPVLASSSLDAKIWHGHWPIVKRDCDTSKILQPIYKVEEPGGILAESFDRKSRKQVSKNISERLRFRKCVAPVRLEKAIKAYYGIGDWVPVFEELRYVYVEESNNIAASEM